LSAWRGPPPRGQLKEEGDVVHSLREETSMLEIVAALAFILILGLLYAAFAVDD
jgi:hypothetical protein